MEKNMQNVIGILNHVSALTAPNAADSPEKKFAKSVIRYVTVAACSLVVLDDAPSLQ